jgi:hypothetical protein
MPDFTVSNLGSVWLLYPQTDPALDWVRDNLCDYVDGMWWDGGNAIPVEPRYITDIVAGIRDAGLTAHAV